MVPTAISMAAVIDRHHTQMPRYVVVPSSVVAEWALEGTTVVEGEINGHSMGRRSLKPWDDERWFIDLPEKLCRTAGVETGDRVDLEIRIASADLPLELSRLLTESPSARHRWDQLSFSRQRMIREYILAAKRPETRERRAHKSLGVTSCS